MTDHVDPSTIEQTVGVKRHATAHVGYADAKKTGQFTIMHSEECVQRLEDLTMCRYSVALDAGINRSLWRGWEDRPVLLSVISNSLLPGDLLGTMELIVDKVVEPEKERVMVGGFDVTLFPRRDQVVKFRTQEWDVTGGVLIATDIDDNTILYPLANVWKVLIAPAVDES